jgi:hypothetical protein
LPLYSKFAGLNPAEVYGILRAITIRSTTSFSGEVSRRPYVVDLRHIKEPNEYKKRYVLDKIQYFLHHVFLLRHLMTLLLQLRESSGGRIGSFPCRYHSIVAFHTHIITCGMNNIPVGGRSSET